MQAIQVKRALTVAACALVLPACDVSVDAQGFTTRDEKRFTTTGMPQLTLATFDGSIEVRSWDRPEVHVVIERRGQNRDEVESIEIKAEQLGDRISVEARRPSQREHRIGFGYHVGRSAKLVASVPRRTNVLARSGDGSIVAEAIDGRVELRTGDGGITGEELNGQVRVHTGDGNVKLVNVDGAVDVDTSDGGISVDGRFSRLNARSGDGRIVVRAKAGSAVAEDWTVTTGDGSIDIELPEPFHADLDAHTGDGTIQVSDVRVTATGEMGRRTVQGKIGDGGGKLKVRSGDGGIRLRGAMMAEKTESGR